MAGDLTGSAALPSIANNAVTNAKLDKVNIPLSGFGAAAADVALGGNKLTGVANPGSAQDAATKSYVDTATSSIKTLADGKIYLGNATNVATAVTPTGDVTITNAGVTAIGTGKVTNAMLAGSIDLTDKVTGVLPIANGGTGSSTQNFVDLTTAQTIAGDKIFNGNILGGSLTINNNGAANTTTIGGGTTTGAVTLGGTGTQSINVGTGAGVKTVTVGSSNTTSATTIQSGTGALTLTPAATGTTVIGNTAGTGTITLGSSNAAQTTNLGTGSGASTVNIATGAAVNTVNVGTGSAANIISMGGASSQVIVGQTTATNASAALEVSSTTKGFLPPRMTNAQIKAITNPALALVIYCTDCGGGELQLFNGYQWTNAVTGLASTAIVLPNMVGCAGGRIWKDRNLGASQVATSSADGAAYGDLYQWGRATDGHEKRSSATTATLATTDTPGHGMFITGTGDDWRTPQNDALWQWNNTTGTGPNNPCPLGFRVPTAAEWMAEINSTGFTPKTSTGGYTCLKLTRGGYRDSNGLISDSGSFGTGYYWTSTVAGTKAYPLYINSSYATVPSSPAGTVRTRIWGMSVRCIKN